LESFEEADNKARHLHDFFADATVRLDEPGPAERAVSIILERHGMIQVAELCDICSVGERQLERHFEHYVGLSPKFFARVIRFARIFEHIKTRDWKWVELALESGFYDQAHFAKNFKAFTGEYPSEYPFDEENLANFFLKRG
jgi:AraC-like DNA-binding protein